MESKKVCEICKFDDTNDLDLGEWHTLDDCTIHLFCALFSTHSVQRGEDNNGLGGFLVKDIRDLVKLHRTTPCRYCKKKSASIRCAIKGCTRYFHLTCGVTNDCLNIFDNKFESLCNIHVNIKEKYEIHSDFWKCQICFDPMGDYNKITSIPSCCNQGYFHKNCMQKHARAAGLLLKCPCCGNQKGEDGVEYRHFMQQRGIYCPEKDGDWETTGAFADIERLNNVCIAENCRCPNGREYSKKTGRWFIHRCRFCGDRGIHQRCRDSAENDTPFECYDCHLKSNTLISVNTQSAHNQSNESCVDNNNDEGAENASATVKSSEKHPYEPEDSEHKVWKLAKTEKLPHRKTSLMLINIDEENTVDPMGQSQRKNMSDDRLKMFFAKCDFSSKKRKLS